MISVDGVWLEWADWDSCSVTCGGGSQNRTRACLGPFHGGSECPGSEHDQQDCNTHSCPGMYTSTMLLLYFNFKIAYVS